MEGGFFMANGYWVIRTYTAGAVGEKIKYWVPGEKPTKSERKIKSDIKQVQRNEANAEKALARLIHANFTPRDYLLQFSYTEEALERLRAGELTEEELFEAAEIALEKWSAGSTHREHLYDQVDQTPLAHYLLAQVRHRPNEKKYSPSRNLIVPQPKDRIAVSGAELQVPRGGQLLLRAGWMPGMPQYIRYIVPEVGKIRRGEAPPEKTRE